MAANRLYGCKIDEIATNPYYFTSPARQDHVVRPQDEHITD